MNRMMEPGGKISGRIAAPPSKSDAHRALICAALYGGSVTGAGDSDDVRATVSALGALGFAVRTVGNKISFERQPEALCTSEVDCAESGSTLRFLLPVCGALGLTRVFTGAGKLPERPVGPILREMKRFGAVCEGKKLPLRLSGHLRTGNYTIEGNISSQFISGLLMALPLLGGGSTVTVPGRLESAAYVDMTIKTLERFGIRWAADETAEGTVFRLADAMPAPCDYTVEGDWSGAAFLLTSGALGGRVTVTGLCRDSLQGDRAIAEILESMGAEVAWDRDEITVTKTGPLRPADIDVSGIPDLFPILVVAAAGARGDSRFTGTARLRIKESDRIESMFLTLAAIGGSMSVSGDTVTVRGTGRLKGGRLDSCGDHRIAMSGAVASLICGEAVEIEGAECCAKSYPGFFRDLRALEEAADEI